MPNTVSPNKKPKVGQARLFLRPDEANALIAAAGKRGRYPFRDKVLVRLVYRHGLRASEAVGLRWQHVDLERGTLTIIRAKGGTPSVHHFDRDELRDLRKLRAVDTNVPYVFTTERGGPLSVDSLQYIIAEAGKLAGIPEAHPHMLRHAAGYALINNGVDVRTVQAFLGHRSITNTTRYTELAPQRLAAVRVR